MTEGPPQRPETLQTSQHPRTLSRRKALAAARVTAAGFSALLAACAPGTSPSRPKTDSQSLKQGREDQTPSVPSAPNAETPVARPSVTVRVKVSQRLRPISPLIYGVAAARPEDMEHLRPKLHRWGGNPTSRYNWELGNALNAARDWEFRNGNYNNKQPEHRKPSGVADQFVTESRAAGVEPMITVPALGWVARDDNTDTRSLEIPHTSGPPLPGATHLGAIAGYDPSENRKRTSVASFARKPGPLADAPDLQDEAVYQDEWIHHLVKRFGTARDGGVGYYIVGNEPDLWDHTHTDVHPARLSYDDLLAVYLEYANAIKDVDPSARILGPAISGWTGMLYSPLDRGTDNFRTYADRKAHGNVPLLAWWLDHVRQHDERAGRRTLDLVDVHWYPQGQSVYSPKDDPITAALRLRSTRSLWDPTYRDESWIGDTVRLIPRLREWIDRHYPGTGLAIGEWNWGAEKTMNGALATADVLGIFGREGVDMATYWTVPPKGSPGAFAFRMYTNYDGEGSTFGDEALAVQTPASPNDLGVYASRDTKRNELAVMIINKQPDKSVPLALLVEDIMPKGKARVYQYGPSHLDAIRPQKEVTPTGRQLALTLSPYTITLVRLALWSGFPHPCLAVPQGSRGAERPAGEVSSHRRYVRLAQ